MALSTFPFRIPQQEWAASALPLGANGLPVAEGVVRWFDLKTGSGIEALSIK